MTFRIGISIDFEVMERTRLIDRIASISVIVLVSIPDVAGETDRAALTRAADFLESTQRESGEWPDGEFVGVFFETALLNYRLYRQYFPVMALARIIDPNEAEAILQRGQADFVGLGRALMEAMK